MRVRFVWIYQPTGEVHDDHVLDLSTADGAIATLFQRTDAKRVMVDYSDAYTLIATLQRAEAVSD